MQFLHLNRDKFNPMKKTTLLFLIFSLSVLSRAQNKIAFVGGANLSNVIEKNNLPAWEYTGSIPNWDAVKKKYDPRTGFHAGFIAQLPFGPHSKLFFMPGAIFYNKGHKFSFVSDTLALQQRANLPDTLINTKYKYGQKEYINYIDIPLNLLCKLPIGKKLKFVLGGGPYVSFFFNGFDNRTHTVVSVKNREENNEDLPVGKAKGQYSTMDYGVNGLAGFELGRVFLTANYSRGFKSFYKSKEYEGDFLHEVYGATLGIFLGQPVKIDKQPKDKDKDGIPDDKDGCPGEPGTAFTNGCPDKDGDGIADKDDKCPDMAGLVKNNGCPVLDKDNDGINDADDKCPDIAGIKKYNGCPVPDTDKDGLSDEEDKCPESAGPARNQGCPIPDSDGDGLDDENDKCPAVKGTPANKGCPEEIKKEIIEKVNYAAQRIQFQSSKAILLPASFNVLDEVVALLKQSPEIKVSIEGHTSSDGSPAFNTKLSQDRAASVQRYLLSKGIAEERLTARGLGSSQPVESDKTAAGKAKNRRVELKLSY